jgi:hypothetical protein
MPRKRPFPKGSVCKPCWELKYCPYGQLVEYFPFAPVTRNPAEVRADYQEVLSQLTDGAPKTEETVWELIERLHLHVPWIQEELRDYAPEDIGCKIWGHSCPVFFVQSGATETKDSRRESRTIPRNVMLQVVRRDNHVCQACHQYVPDTELEFDHIIPYSKGGPTTVANIRLLCQACNRKKSDSLRDLLLE